MKFNRTLKNRLKNLPRCSEKILLFSRIICRLECIWPERMWWDSYPGDMAYDLFSNNGQTGDQYFATLEPLFATVPYMVVAGNHEAEVRLFIDSPAIKSSKSGRQEIEDWISMSSLFYDDVLRFCAQARQISVFQKSVNCRRIGTQTTRRTWIRSRCPMRDTETISSIGNNSFFFRRFLSGISTNEISEPNTVFESHLIRNL